MSRFVIAVAALLACAGCPPAERDFSRMGGNWSGTGRWTNGLGGFDCTVTSKLAPFEGKLVGTIRAIGDGLEAVANVTIDAVDDDGDVDREYDSCDQSGINAADFDCPFENVASTDDDWNWDGEDQIEIDADDRDFDGSNHVAVELERD